jgi:predicted DsbA family dithiol-disulfide isomerase
MSNEKNNTPLLIIGAVAVIAIIGGIWLYNSSSTPVAPKKPGDSASSPSKPSGSADLFKNAPAGAEPSWSKGAVNAAVTIEEFVDFACPQCAAKAPIVQQARGAYGDRVRVIFRHFPLDIPPHKNADAASLAAEAAGEQGKFWEMENLIFKNQSSWQPPSVNPRPIFEEYAKQIGLDVVKFSNDMVAMGARSRVDKDKQRGRALNVSSTPSIYLNNRLLDISEVTPENLKKLIDAELAKTAAPAAAPAGNSNSNPTPVAN